MDQTTVVRAFAAAYAVLAVCGAVILWLNAGASDAAKNAIITLASALPLAAAVAAYLVPQASKEHHVLMLIYDTKQKQFTFGDVPGSPYYATYGDWFVGGPVTASSLEEASKIGFDLLERTILVQWGMRLGSAWDVSFASVRIPSVVGLRISTPRTRKVAEGVTVTKDALLALFSYNSLVNRDLLVRQVMLPPDSKFTTTPLESPLKGRKLEVDNPYFTFDANLTQAGFSVAQRGVEGVLSAPGSDDINRYYVLLYNADLEFRPSRWRLYSPEMPAYSNWYENVSAIYREYGVDAIFKNGQ